MPARKSTRRTCSEQERQAARDRQQEQVESSVRELLTSEGWRRWAETRATFHSYSFGNCMLIALQCPQATQVAGFRKWQELGRQVRKGERSIRIMAPMSVKRENAETGETERVPFFRAVPVFDLGQTDGEPLPEAPREAVTGDSHAGYLEPNLRDRAAVEWDTLQAELATYGRDAYNAAMRDLGYRDLVDQLPRSRGGGAQQKRCEWDGGSCSGYAAGRYCNEHRAGHGHYSERRGA
jgi:hypothetical protein